MPSAEPAPGVVRDMTHHRVGDGIPEDGDGHGETRLCMSQSESVRIVHHGEPEERIHHERIAALTDGIADHT